jgi:hypothetical protein
MVSNKAQPNNHPIYSVETKIFSSIFFNDLSFEEEVPKTNMTIIEKPDQQNNAETEMWNMSFDGAINREGAWASVWINPPKLGTKLCSYKLAFNCTNNMAEYEALVLGLKSLKEMGARSVRKTGPRSNKIKQMQKQNTEDTQYKRDTDLRGSPSVGYVHQRNCQVLPLLLSNK